MHIIHTYIHYFPFSFLHRHPQYSLSWLQPSGGGVAFKPVLGPWTPSLGRACQYSIPTQPHTLGSYLCLLCTPFAWATVSPHCFPFYLHPFSSHFNTRGSQLPCCKLLGGRPSINVKCCCCPPRKETKILLVFNFSVSLYLSSQTVFYMIYLVYVPFSPCRLLNYPSYFIFSLQ